MKNTARVPHFPFYPLCMGSACFVSHSLATILRNDVLGADWEDPPLLVQQNGKARMPQVRSEQRDLKTGTISCLENKKWAGNKSPEEVQRNM